VTGSSLFQNPCFLVIGETGWGVADCIKRVAQQSVRSSGDLSCGNADEDRLSLES
jgi:hypothetical protein